MSRSTYVGANLLTLYPLTYATPAPNSTEYFDSAAVAPDEVVAPAAYTPLLNPSSRFCLTVTSKSLTT